MKTDAKFDEALDFISKEIGELEIKRGRLEIDSKAFCETYKKIKPFFESMLPTIEASVPKGGKEIAVVIRILMGLADSGCGVE